MGIIVGGPAVSMVAGHWEPEEDPIKFKKEWRFVTQTQHKLAWCQEVWCRYINDVECGYYTDEEYIMYKLTHNLE